MPLQLKAGAETDGLPTITLAGNPYFVAPLLLRQKIANMPLMPRALELARKFIAFGAAIDSKGQAPEFSEADFDPLIDVVVNGLRRLYPAITRDDLLDSDLDAAELLNAVPVIITQSGGKKGDTEAGERAAASDLKTSTGASSPRSSA